MSINIHNNIHQKLNYFYETNKIPHLLFHGSSGCGKRTIVHQYLNKIYQNDHKKMKSNIMHVNCAHGKGIKFIREELKFFAKSNVQSNTGILFKTIVLLNADNLTIDAQSALRRCIELFSSNTRFFIIVENKNKLLNPILSRFCEIYVPEYMSGGKIVNLNQLSVESETNSASTIEKQVSDKMAAFMSTKDSARVHSAGVDVANEFYENGISCLDVIKWIEKTEAIDSKKRASALMYFDEIKFEYRCEKLLMLCIFDYLSIH
jgi:replication-associated recombination protein RarA